ncbi:MAG: SDR family oxidoreductase, partial [Chitinophagaceae bacterium]
PDVCELDREGSFEINVKGTRHLLQSAQKIKSFFVYLSTDFVFDGSKLNYTETDVLQPVNYYGETKKRAEEEVQQYAHGWAIVRTILVYAPPRGTRHNILTMVAQGLKEGRDLKIVDDQVRTPTFVEDLVSAIATIIERKKRGIYHLSGAEVTTPYQMACAVADHLRLDKNRIQKVTAESFNEPARRPRTTGFDLTKAATELDYNPTPFSEGLKKTFKDWE